MRNIYALFIAIGIIISSIADAFAAHVDSTRVMQSALGFFSALTHTPTERLLSEGVSIAYRACAAETAGSHAGAVCFYVINVGQKGFVMLSGDDRITPVLGYSYESSFNTKNMPENLRNWLEARRKEISSALGSGTLFPSPGIIQQWNHLPEIGATMSVVVQPLLQTTWDQNAYYNQYCPEDMIGPNGHAYAGCVATAMAQIIRYWEWPASGFDSHSYTCAYGTQSVDFSTANYNYSDMPNSIQGSSSLTQIDAVAMLTYHCGVSVDMDYGPDGSGAYSAYVPYALFHYFAYPPGMSYQSKSSYSSSEWNNLLRNELNNGRPILYSGGEGSGGHSFICDGYDNNGTYHFNWGWSGNFNGYFALNALTPGPFDFSDGQTAAIGISADGSFLRCSQNGLNVSAPIGGYSEVKTVDVRGHSLNGNITVTAGNGFVVGADGNTFSNSVTIPAQGGRLYVKYTPTLTFPGTQNANVVLASGSVRDTVFCYGTAVEEVCLPPRDLTGTHTGNQVHLSWSEPVEYVSGSPASVTLSWDSTVMGVSASIGSDLTLCMMQRFDVNDLAPYHHYLLNSISFIPSAQGTSFRLVAFKGGNYSNGYYPGTQVVNQEIPAASLVRGTWNTVQLNSPVLVDVTEELWFGFVVYTTGNNGNVICLSTGNHVPGKGNVFGVINGYNDGTGNFYWEPVTLSYNFPIKGMLEQISADVVRYHVYRNASQIGSSTSTSYIDNSPSASNCEYTVTAMWDNNCTQSAFVMVNQPVVSLPTVTTGDVSNITTSSATCGGDVTSAGGSTVTARGICWSTSQNPTVDGSHSTDNGNDLGTFTSNITGLTPNTTYYVRAYATNNAGTAYGVQKSFKTSCNSVTVSIMGNSTVSYGQSTTLTASGASTYHWSTNENTASITVSPTSTTTYTVTGTNSYGCTATASKTVTVNADLPTVTTIEVFNITTLTAVCSCEVSSDGGSTVTVRGVCWSTSPIPTINDSHTADSSGTGSFASFISGLTPNTAYYVRAYATSNMGTAYGEVLSFTTAEVSSDGQPCPNYPTVTDIDGNVYNTVQIGDQCWTRENLRTTRYANGTEIALGSGISETTAYRYYPNNNSDNVATYGYLYNWAAVMHGAPSTDSIPSGVQGLCPAGWHVPSIWEWSQLTFFIRSQDQYFCSNNSLYFAKSLASITGWNASSAECGVGNDPGTNNATNFSVLAAGYYYGDASDFGNYTYLWSTSESEDNNIYSYGFCNDQAFAAVISNTYKTLGLSVRCLLDEGNTSSLPTVITHQVATVTSNSATCGGNVISDGGAPVTARGVCWSTSPNPTLSDNHTTDSSGTGLFTCFISGLTPNMTYYVKAYATNSVGTAYGEQRMFTTSCTNFLIADTVAVCGNYTWNGETYTESGDYVQILQTAYGCDSVVTLHLTVYHSWTCDTTCVACDSFTWHGVMYTETPVVAPIHTYQTAHGCDSVVTLHLHIIHSKTVTLDSVVCANELPFTWNGLTFTEAGTQTLALVSTEGCDSVVVMTLQVNGCGPVVDEKSCPAAPTVTDHEGNVYATVQIGNQCWMRDNLRTSTSPSTGTYLIPAAGTTYTYTGKQARWYNNDSTIYAPMNYGLLYNWNAAVDTFNTAYGETSVNTSSSNVVSVSFTGHRRGICPVGWHLPSDGEWTEMTDYVSSQSEYVCGDTNINIAKALASTEGWSSNTSACAVGNTPESNNKTGFSALPSGGFDGSSFGSFGTNASFWSSTENGWLDAYYRALGCDASFVYRDDDDKSISNCSVRCLRDEMSSATVIDSRSCPAAPTVTDHEGNVYATVLIGNQCWMRDNLRTTTSPTTGTYLIPAAVTSYTYTGKQARWYNDDSTTYAPMNYGMLYNWNAAVDTFNTAYGETSVNTSINNAVSVSFNGNRRGICPVGWHLPSDAEWTTLRNHVGNQNLYVCDTDNANIAKALASTMDWNISTNSCAVGNNQSGNNATGFGALPAGSCSNSSFYFANNATYFWSSSEYNNLTALYRSIVNYAANVASSKNLKNCGFSVRCLRDSVGGPTSQTQPTVTTEEATDITSSSATLNGTVANPDNVTITAQGFQWKASQGGTYSVVNASGATMSYNLTGLAANTSYTYRAFATTEEGTSYGEEMNFTTHCPTIKITGPSCSFIFGNITLVASGADNYIWSTGDSSATITVAQSNTTTYSVTGTDSYGCVGTDSMLVAVYPSFNPTEVGTGLSDIEVNCNNSTVTLCANVVVNSTKDYIVESIPYNPPFGFAEGTRIFNAGDEDSWGASIHLPFNFSFYGLCYSNVYPGSNSVLTFNYPPQQCNWHYTDSIPNTNLFANTIFACYRDLDIGNLGIDGGVFDTVYGESPNRCFKLSFNNVGLYSDNSLSNTFSSMIILHEGTNIIDIYLRDAPTIVSWNNGNGVLGLQNRTGDKGITPPGRNTGPWTAHEEAWRFIPVADSNYTVTWYLGNTALSTGIIVGTGDTITVSPQESTDYTARLQYTDDCGNKFFLFQTCHVTVNKEGPIVTVNASQNELCEGDNTTLLATGADTYLWSTGNATDSITVSPTSTTTYYVTGYTGQTCSSVDSITVIVWESFDTLFNITVCDSYIWNDSVYTSSGDYVQHFQTIHGCDSTVTLHLTVNHSDATDMYATSCDSYTWNGVTYHESGDYLLYLTNAVGCDSIVTMHLTINYSDTIEFSATACNNYNWNGITYTESGDYVANMTNASGCDLVVVLHLTVNHSDTTDLYASACDSYSWNGATYYASGDYVHTFTNVAGCDSVVTLHLTINLSVHSDLFVSDCESYTWNGTTYTLSGDHVQTFTSVNGCDSVVTMHLVLNNTDALECDTTVCDIFTWNDMTYSASGDYVQTFINKNGCDSVVTLHLTVNHSCSTILQATACDIYTWNGVTYTESGDYPLYLTNAVGCDSIVTLHLTINYSDTIEFSATACNSYNWNGVTYTESGDYTTYMTNASGCNLLLVLHLTVNHSDTTNLYASACDSYFWNGTTYYVSGNYVHAFTNAAGCDSVVTLHLTISSTDHTNVMEEACDSYTWNGEVYTESGVYTQTFTNAAGCDSVVTLHLTVSNTSHTDISEEACDSYTWNGEVYTESGLYTETFTNVNGCDSVVTLHLTVNHSDTIDFYATACDSYNWNDETYTESGDYTHLMTSSTGCNLVAMLHLTINHSEITEFDISTEDSCYVWNGTTYCSSGDYIQTMQTEDGCDSLIILHLTITVGIDDHELTSSMILYPNPTDNIVNVKLSIDQMPEISDVEIQLYDMYGKFLQTVPVKDEFTSIDLSSYASGVYFVKAVVDGQVMAIRKAVRR